MNIEDEKKEDFTKSFILKKTIMRLTTNGGLPCKQYVCLAQDGNGKSAILILKLVLANSEYESFKKHGFVPIKKHLGFKEHKGYVLFATKFSIKLETLDAVKDWADSCRHLVSKS